MTAPMTRAALFVLLTLLASHAPGARAEQAITLPAGRTHVALHGKVTAAEDRVYTLTAAERQVLSLRFAPTGANCYMNVWAPGGDSPTHRGREQGRDFVANLARPGPYRIQVFHAGSDAAGHCGYRLDVHLTSAGSPLPLPDVAQGRDALRQGIERCLELAGDGAEVVASTAITPGVWKLLLVADDAETPVGCTVRADGNLEDWEGP